MSNSQPLSILADISILPAIEKYFDKLELEEGEENRSSITPTNRGTQDVTAYGNLPSKKNHTDLPWKQKHVRARDAKKAAKFQAKKEKESSNLFTTCSVSKIPLIGGYLGRRVPDNVIPSTRKVIPMGDGQSVKVFSREDQLIVYRGFFGPSSKAANESAMAAHEYINRNKIPPCHKSTHRGIFSSYMWMLHKENQLAPHLNNYALKNMEAANDLIKILSPLISMVERTFKAQFPKLFSYYGSALQFIHEWNSSLPMWCYPFAGICINTGVVVCKKHTDWLNFGPGLCCVVPFGTFLPGCDCRLVIEELGLEFEVAPGVPIFFPSALFEHYNTALESKGMRGSIVFWTGGTLFQWVDLGGASVGEFNVAQRENYLRMRSARIREAIARFPVRQM